MYKNNNMNTLGMQHIALFTNKLEELVSFYKILNFRVIWKPDNDNYYLTSTGVDNLALHRIKDRKKYQNVENNFFNKLDHIGILVPTFDDVDSWFHFLKKKGVKIIKNISIHRDNSKSFYLKDPDNNIIQIICINNK